MFKKIVEFVRGFVTIYSCKYLPRASAALSYCLTLTFFPLIICLYTMLGNSYDKALLIVAFAENLMAAETVEFLRKFLEYVASNNSSAMMVAGVTALVTSASAAVRSLQATIGEMQGKQRYQGLGGFLFSVAFSVVFLAAIYFAIIVMLTGRGFLDKLNELLPFIDISHTWDSVRFLLLAGIDFIIILGVYEVSMATDQRYSSWPGALAATGAMVGVSAVYSAFIGASAKYPLVYGSLASIILLMLWLYSCCLVIYSGAAINIEIRDIREKRSAG